MSTKIVERQPLSDYRYKGDSLVAKLYAARGVTCASDISKSLKDLIPFTEMHDILKAADIILDFAKHKKNIVIVGDFDADGATSTALLMLLLTDFGFKDNINFLIPNRFELGYGLSTALIDLAIEKYDAELLITVDNGVTAIDEIAYAKEKGLKVVITDHHIQSEKGLPNADAIVNPNLEAHPFPSRNLAGVGVVFYVGIALRHQLREENYFESNGIADLNLAKYLDLVALGTVADMVELDRNNRLLVQQGIMRIQCGRGSMGINALLAVSQKDSAGISSVDLGYAIGPRLNAAGRISDMSIGVKCLMSRDPEEADRLAATLNDLNIERRQIEADMQNSATEIINSICESKEFESLPLGLCLYDESWHQGVAGIIASRMKEKFKRPVVILTKSNEEELKGSARSIKVFDIRKALAEINDIHPGMIVKFGGHKGAAGLTIKASMYQEFSESFDKQVKKGLSEQDCCAEIKTDGELNATEMTIETAQAIRNAGPWGMGFPEPIFLGTFTIMEQRIVGQRHLKLALQPNGGYEIINAICFNIELGEWLDEECTHIKCVYKLDVAEYRGCPQLQLIVQYIEKVKVESKVEMIEF